MPGEITREERLFQIALIIEEHGEPTPWALRRADEILSLMGWEADNEGADVKTDDPFYDVAVAAVERFLDAWDVYDIARTGPYARVVERRVKELREAMEAWCNHPEETDA